MMQVTAQTENWEPPSEDGSLSMSWSRVREAQQEVTNLYSVTSDPMISKILTIVTTKDVTLHYGKKNNGLHLRFGLSIF
jgi:hypothetical protein